MRLEELIDMLKTFPPERVVSFGFGHPHAYRGYYAQVAFRPERNTKVAEMLEAAESAMRGTFNGYKGGEYTYDLSTPVWLAHWGDTGSLMSPALLQMMLGDAERLYDENAPSARADQFSVKYPSPWIPPEGDWHPAYFVNAARESLKEVLELCSHADDINDPRLKIQIAARRTLSMLEAKEDER